MQQLFYYKMRQKFITKCISLCITQSAIVLLQIAGGCKMRCLLQNALLHPI